MLNNSFLRKENLIHNPQMDDNIKNQTYEIYNKEDLSPSNTLDIGKEQIKENIDNYDSDIDDPKYRPNTNILINQNENYIIDNNVENKYLDKNNEYNIIKSKHPLYCYKFHNYDNIKITDKENLYQNNNILELQNENELLKEELFKRAQIIKNKDEIIAEYQSLLTNFKNKFIQYETMNNQLKQQIIFLEQILNTKNNEQNINTTKKDIDGNENENENNNIMFYKQQIDELQSQYDLHTKKLNEKYKEKEKLLMKEKNEQFTKVSKNIEQIKLENEKLKSETINNQLEINTLKEQLENNEEEKNEIINQKNKENLKLKEKLSEKEKEIKEIENDYNQKINKLEEQINLLKDENNNLLNNINENQDKTNNYESEIINLKNNNDMLNNELNQANIGINNKDAVINQFKNQIEELNQLLIQSEEDLKSFEENKQQEFAEYNNQIELLIQEKNILQAQNIELTENLSIANENLKKFNELISDKYSNIEAELYRKNNINENLEKKYNDVLKQVKKKENILNKENMQLKEILNKDMEESDINNKNKIQNYALYKTIMGNKGGVNPIIGNNINNNMLNTAINTNAILNNNEKKIIQKNEIDYEDFTYNYMIPNSSYIDPKEDGQKKTLNEFKSLLNKIDEKLDMNI